MCDYDLSGHTAGVPVVCPECGARVPAGPAQPAPLTPLLRWACLPTAAAVVLLGIAALIPFSSVHRDLFPLALRLVEISGLTAPLQAALWASIWRRPRPTIARRFQLVFHGCLINVLIALGGLVLFVLIGAMIMAVE